jgi:hypothetical protein
VFLSGTFKATHSRYSYEKYRQLKLENEIMEMNEVLPWIFLALFALWSVSRSRDSEIGNLSRLERKIDYLLKHFELNPKEAADVHLSAEVIGLIKTGKKIAAIKQLRKETQMDLREAKEAVEQFEDPERMR